MSRYTSNPPVSTTITNAKLAAFCSRRIVPQTNICHATVAPRACSTPSSGAVSACVSGTVIRAGPISATVCSIAARLAPYPQRNPRRAPARAIAAPPASATQNPIDGIARDARNDTVAT